MIGKLVCYFRGHQRGKAVHKDEKHVTLKCPRCNATWKRSIRKPS